MSEPSLQFRPINLQQHADLCLKFIAETHLCSFGSMEGFECEGGQGPERFIDRIASKLSQDSESCLHVWQGDTVVGQLNFGTFVDPAIGYISHFYVTPERRGTGVASEMEAYAGRHLRRRGFRSARLSVIQTNVRAVRFYQRHGWRDLGPRVDRPLTHDMEKTYV